MDFPQPLLRRANQEQPLLTKAQALAIGISFIVPGVLLSLGRIAIRIKQFRRLHADDIFVLIAVVLAISLQIVYGYGLSAILEVQRRSKLYLFGEAYDKVFSRYLRLQLAGALLYWTAIWTVKLSVLAFFRRLGNNVKSVQILWWVTLVFTVLSYIGCVISYQFYCHSFGAWECIAPKNTRGALISFRYSSAVDIVSDLLIVIIPIRLLWNVQIPLKKKLVLLALLCATCFVMAAAGIRLAVVNKANTVPQPTWNAVWCAIEVGISLAVCNLITIRSLFVQAGRPSDGSGSGGSASPGRSGNTFARRFFQIGNGSFFQRSKGSSASTSHINRFAKSSKLESGELSSPSSHGSPTPVAVTRMTLGEKGWTRTTSEGSIPPTPPPPTKAKKERNYEAFLTTSGSQEDLTKMDGAVMVKTSFGVDSQRRKEGK